MMEKIKFEKPDVIIKTEEQEQKTKNTSNITEQNPENTRRPDTRPESRMMNFFNQEFIERKIDFKPKYEDINLRKILSEQSLLKEDIKSAIKSSKIYDKLLEIEKNIDENMYKKRLEVQENLIMPSPKVKALLRVHIFGFFQPKIEDNLNSVDNMYDGADDEMNWVLRIQGKIMNYLESQNGGFYRKFSFFFQKIVVKFDPDNNEKYSDIEWNRQSGSSDIDGFEIKRRGISPVKMKIIFYLNSYTQELKVSDELSAIIGIKQDTRPRIIHALWQYIKLNRLQDIENSKLILNNKELQAIFGVEKMDITSIPCKLNDHLKLPDPIEISYTLDSFTNAQEGSSLYDFIVTIDDPHYLDISNFLSNIDNESILFPKSLFYNKAENSQSKDKNQQTFAEKFYNKLTEYDRNINDLIEKLKKHKYKYDFYEAYAKDPIKFINNFLIQQNFLLKIIKDESSVIDSRWDYQSAQYYKDYEDVLRDYTDSYLNKVKTQHNNTNQNI